MNVMCIMRHNPESCADFNPAVKKTTETAMKAIDTVNAKHGVELAGFWHDMAGHTIYVIYDTPTVDACLAMLNEPEMAALLATNTAEIKVVKSLEETRAAL